MQNTTKNYTAKNISVCRGCVDFDTIKFTANSDHDALIYLVNYVNENSYFCNYEVSEVLAMQDSEIIEVLNVYNEEEGFYKLMQDKRVVYEFSVDEYLD